MLLRQSPLLIAAVVLLSATLAQAEDVDFEASREAGYLGLSGVFGIETLSSEDAVGLSLGNGGGFSARMGFRMARYAAVEFEAEYLSGLGSDIENLYNFTANLKGIYPCGPDDRIQPFLIAGVGVMSATVTRAKSKAKTDGVYKLGGGVDYFVTRNWVAQMAVGWVADMSNRTTISYVAIRAGITYNFR